MRRLSAAFALILLPVAAPLWLASGCSVVEDESAGTATDAATDSAAATGTSASGGSGASTGTTGGSTGGTGGSDSATSGSSAATSAGSGSSTGSTGGSSDGGSSATSTSGASTDGASTGDPADPHAAARAACVAAINEFRATKGAAPLAAWPEIYDCADGQVTTDEAGNDAHGTFGDCGESGQNMCLGGGPDGVAGCLQRMWDEKDQAGCAGCDACAGAYTDQCPSCDFYGDQTGDVCGHYVNMRAEYFTKVACGFSRSGDWTVMNFR